MFGKFVHNYYYGKSGQGDYTPEDLPKTRLQLFLRCCVCASTACAA